MIFVVLDIRTDIEIFSQVFHFLGLAKRALIAKPPPCPFTTIIPHIMSQQSDDEDGDYTEGEDNNSYDYEYCEDEGK